MVYQFFVAFRNPLTPALATALARACQGARSRAFTSAADWISSWANFTEEGGSTMELHTFEED